MGSHALSQGLLSRDSQEGQPQAGPIVKESFGGYDQATLVGPDLTSLSANDVSVKVGRSTERRMAALYFVYKQNHLLSILLSRLLAPS